MIARDEQHRRIGALVAAEAHWAARYTAGAEPGVDSILDENVTGARHWILQIGPDVVPEVRAALQARVDELDRVEWSNFERRLHAMLSDPIGPVGAAAVAA